MTPSPPHRVTIGTGERRIRSTVVRSTWGQSDIGPRLVAPQS
ncbi:hypothetical protein [Massilia sp. KIM]|nr:hypothetical protein [Massilia sp. KIM]